MSMSRVAQCVGAGKARSNIRAHPGQREKERERETGGREGETCVWRRGAGATWCCALKILRTSAHHRALRPHSPFLCLALRVSEALSLSPSLPPYLSALAALCPTPSLAFSLTFHAPSSTPPCSPPPCRLCTSAGSRRSCAKHARAPKCAKPSRMRGGREARPQQRQRNRRWCRHDDDDDVYRYYNC